MKPRSFAVLLTALLILTAGLQAQKIKVIVDQDARGPGTSDQQALLVFLQSDKFEVLGITTVSGDQWVKEETQHTLRMLEIAQRTDVPVIQGAEFPLLNSKEETERWEALYGKLEYKGCWTDRFEANRSTIYDEPYHAPDIVPPMKEGAPHIQAAPGTAATCSAPCRRPWSPGPSGRWSSSREHRDQRGLRRRRAHRADLGAPLVRTL